MRSAYIASDPQQCQQAGCNQAAAVVCAGAGGAVPC